MYIKDNYSTNRLGREGKLGDDDDRTLVSAAAGCKSQLSSHSSPVTLVQYASTRTQRDNPHLRVAAVTKRANFHHSAPCRMTGHDWSRFCVISRRFQPFNIEASYSSIWCARRRAHWTREFGNQRRQSWTFLVVV